MGGNVPLGYDPNGRTLVINETEAKTIRTLFDLYEEHGTVRQVREVAQRLELRTRLRETAAGRKSGGGPFDRGHIHHILTNPIYAGKIRHRTEIHEDQHAAIIAPERWDQIQAQLWDGAAKGRVRKTAKQSSLLCGKLFDEKGDRLTPSQTKTSKGVRLRYYVSHRLIKRSEEANLDGWRLPAPELEAKVAEVIRTKLQSPSFLAQFIPDGKAVEINRWHSTLKAVCERPQIKSPLSLVDTISIQAGELQIALERAAISRLLSVNLDQLEAAALTIKSPFQIRKRGVETKLVLGDATVQLDETLIRNIAQAHHWFAQIKSGLTLSEVTKSNGTTTRRIQHFIELAFLAPDLTKLILDGKHPLGFTSEWVKQHALPSNWYERRAVITTF